MLHKSSLLVFILHFLFFTYLHSTNFSSSQRGRFKSQGCIIISVPWLRGQRRKDVIPMERNDFMYESKGMQNIQGGLCFSEFHLLRSDILW